MSGPSCTVIQYYVNYGIAVSIQCTELDGNLSGDFYDFGSSHLNGCGHSIRWVRNGERKSCSCSLVYLLRGRSRCWLSGERESCSYLLCGCIRSRHWLAGDVAYMFTITSTHALSQCCKVPTHRTLVTCMRYIIIGAAFLVWVGQL